MAEGSDDVVAFDPRRILDLRERASDSPYVDRIWCSGGTGGPMTSVAASHREIVVWHHGGEQHLTVRGPETVPSTLDVPPGFTAFGIVLSHGASMPHFPAGALVDSGIDCLVTGRGAVLGGREWPLPDHETAEVFVERLVRAGLLVRDPLVDDVLLGGTTALGTRSIERRIRRATGLPEGAIRRIERAREAATLLAQAVPIADVVARLGYHDHPHLTRSLNRFVGHGPSWLRAPDIDLRSRTRSTAPPPPSLGSASRRSRRATRAPEDQAWRHPSTRDTSSSASWPCTTRCTARAARRCCSCTGACSTSTSSSVRSCPGSPRTVG